MRKTTVRFHLPSLAALALVLVAPSAFAQSTVYKSNEGGQTGELTLVRRSDGTLSVELEFRRRGCLGSIVASGRQQGSTIVAQAADRFPGQPRCTLRIDVRNKALVVTEEDCIMFHGASCEATGTYRATR
jgi:hypothetical protein